MRALPTVKLTLLGSAIFDDVFEFVLLDVVEGFAFAVEGFECFDHGFCHALVRLLRATDDSETLGLSDALVAVFVIEADTDQVCRGFLRGAVGVFSEAVHLVFSRSVVRLDQDARPACSGCR